MATSERPDSVSESECSICSETLRNPKLLSCCHSFCELCLKLWIEKQDKKLLGIECPLCRNVTKPSGNSVKHTEWVALLPDAKVFAADLDQMWCDPCQTTGEQTHASYFCVECSEHMCVDCHKTHRKLKISRAHVTVETTNESLNSIPIYVEYNKLLKCNVHTEKNIELFCKDHDEIFCSTCAFLYHRSCTDVLEIESNQGKIPTGKALPVTSKWLQNLTKYIEDAIDVHEKFDAKIGNDETLMKEKLKEMQNILNRKFEKYQVKIHEEFKKKNEKCKASNQEHLEKLSTLREQLIVAVKTTKKVTGMGLQKSSPSYIIVTRQLRRKYLQCLDEIKSLTEDKFASFVFKPNKEFHSLLDKSGILGFVMEENSSTNLPQLPQQNQPSITVKISSNKYSSPKSRKTPYFSSVAMSNQSFVLADQNNKRLLICQNDNDVGVINTGRYQPYMIFCTEKTMFVSVPSERKIKTYDIQHDFKEGHGIKTREECYALAYIEQLDIIMSSLHDGERWELVTYDAAGKEIESIDNADWRQFQSIWHLLILGDTIYQPSQEDNQVYAFKLTNRRSVFTYKDPKLDCPGGIHRDLEDNVYICGINSKNIHIITNKGTPIRIVQLNGSIYPTFIHLSDNGDDLIVLGKADNPGPFFFQLQ